MIVEIILIGEMLHYITTPEYIEEVRERLNKKCNGETISALLMEKKIIPIEFAVSNENRFISEEQGHLIF
jgi:hypothetical protein